MSKEGGSGSWYTILVVPVEQFKTAGIVAQCEGMIQLIIPRVPGFQAVLACHIDRYSPLPKELLQVGGTDGMGSLDGGRWLADGIRFRLHS